MHKHQCWGDQSSERASAHPQSDEELVKVDGPASIAVEMLENGRGLFFIDGDPVIVQTLQKLLQVQSPVVVIIHYFESSGEQTNNQTQFGFNCHFSILASPQLIINIKYKYY